MFPRTVTYDLVLCSFTKDLFHFQRLCRFAQRPEANVRIKQKFFRLGSNRQEYTRRARINFVLLLVTTTLLSGPGVLSQNHSSIQTFLHSVAHARYPQDGCGGSSPTRSRNTSWYSATSESSSSSMPRFDRASSEM